MAGERGDGRGQNWTPAPSGGPARNYSWEPFQPGHTLSLRHGARSPRVLAPLAEQIEADLRTTAPWTARPAFAGTLRALARAEAQCELYWRWFDELGLLTEDGEPRPGLDRWEKAEKRASSLRAELGLAPLAYARLLSQVSSAITTAGGGEHDLEALRAEGRRILEAREAADTPRDALSRAQVEHQPSDADGPEDAT